MTRTVFVAAVAAGLGMAVPACAQNLPPAAHRIVPAEHIQWRTAPASLPAGAQIAVLHGDPAQEGIFVLRLRLPDNYLIPPHTHLGTEILTVLSGTFHLGMGTEAPVALQAGSFFALPPGMVHHARAEGETVVQISTNGPWQINYVNPSDDPRLQR